MTTSFKFKPVPTNDHPTPKSHDRQTSSGQFIFDHKVVPKIRPFSGQKIGAQAVRPTVGLTPLVPILCPENGRHSLAEILRPSEVVATTVDSTQCDLKSIEEKAGNLGWQVH